MNDFNSEPEFGASFKAAMAAANDPQVKRKVRAPRGPFARMLRSLGFERRTSSREPIFFELDAGYRRVTVQLWKDGRHRASHMLLNPLDPRLGRGSTFPTEFTTVDGLLAAIVRELSRADHTADPLLPLPSHALREIATERRRQIEVEGWTADHDDEHQCGELARAAASYVLASDPGPQAGAGNGEALAVWPWSLEWWKPQDPCRNLIRAGALIIAEIERLDRAAVRS